MKNFKKINKVKLFDLKDLFEENNEKNSEF